MDHPITANRASGLGADGQVADITNQIGHSKLAIPTSHRFDLFPGVAPGAFGMGSIAEAAMRVIRGVGVRLVSVELADQIVDSVIIDGRPAVRGECDMSNT